MADEDFVLRRTAQLSETHACQRPLRSRGLRGTRDRRCGTACPMDTVRVMPRTTVYRLPTITAIYFGAVERKTEAPGVTADGKRAAERPVADLLRAKRAILCHRSRRNVRSPSATMTAPASCSPAPVPGPMSTASACDARQLALPIFTATTMAAMRTATRPGSCRGVDIRPRSSIEGHGAKPRTMPERRASSAAP